MKRRSAVESTPRKAEAISLCLVIVIIFLTAALLFIGVPISQAMLTTDQINETALRRP